jgi:hypothetical protein
LGDGVLLQIQGEVPLVLRWLNANQSLMAGICRKTLTSWT